MKAKHKRLIGIVAVFLTVSLGAFLFLKSFNENLMFFYNPTQLHEKIAVTPDFVESSKKIRVGGMIKKNSVKRISATQTRFVITDYTKEIKIYYEGILPPMFREGQGIIAIGKVIPKNSASKNIAEPSLIKFKASELMTKHDEKYMPPEIKGIKSGENK